MKTTNVKTLLRNSFLFMIMALWSHAAYSTNYYWVGGTGNWSSLNNWATVSGGTIHPAVVPSPFDNVYFDNLSFSGSGQTVTIDQTIETCLDMNWSGVPANTILNGPNSNSLKIYGSLRFDPNVTLSFQGKTYFEATGTGKTITTAGKVFNNYIYFQGAGGSWLLQDAFNAGSNYIYLINGILNTNNQSVTCAYFNSSPSTIPARSLILGTSTVTITGGSSSSWSIYTDNFTLSATSSTILFTGQNGGMYNSTYNGIYTNLAFNNVGFTNSTGTSQIYYPYSYGNATFKKVTFNCAGQIKGNFTFDTLSFTPNHLYEFESGRTQTINMLLSANGLCNAPISIRSLTAGVQSTISKSAGNITISNASLRDMVGTGGASFVANNSVDLGNNTGWVINVPTPRNLYWVQAGGTGNGSWDDIAHWSLSSGGVGGECVPTANDNVFFDAASYNGSGQSTTINVNAVCRDMTWNGTTGMPNLAGTNTFNLSIYGSLTFSTAMNLTFQGKTYFEANATGKTITSATKVFNNYVYFQGSGGGWTFLDDFNAGSNYIYLINGILNTGNKTVTCAYFNSSPSTIPPRTLIMGTSLMIITGGSSSSWSIYTDNFTLSAASSTIRFTGQNGGMYNSTYNGIYTNLYFNKVQCTNLLGTSQIYYPYSYGVAFFKNVNFACNGQIKGNFTFDTLAFSADKIYEFESGRTQTITSLLTAVGTCVAPITLKSLTSGQQSTITKSSGAITIVYCSLRDMAATGGAVFTANNSTDMGNNSGWIINAPTPRNLYWVPFSGSGTGNWDQTDHWSLTSGGPGGQCIPNAYDNVFFDQNSFTGAGQTATINVSAYCNSMDWTGASNYPTFGGTNTNNLSIYGSLQFINAMNLTYQGKTFFEATATGKTIFTDGKVFNNYVYFQGAGGGWSFLDAFNAGSNYIYLINGILNTNNQQVTCAYFNSSPSSIPNRTLILGTSVFVITGGSSSSWSIYTDNLTLSATSSVIRFTGQNGGMYNSTYNGIYTGLAFNKIECTNTAGTSQIYYPYSYGAASFSKVTFLGNGQLNGNFTFDTLKFAPGKTYEIEAGRTETILSMLDATGLGGFPIDIRSTISGQQGTFSKASGCVVLDFLQLRDNNATGGA
ncbi:MAG: hypothetical protein WCM76_16435, partial [Bacteroidota bacterium]